jgi:hypothetical protein
VLESGSIKIEGLAKDLKNDPQLTEAYFGHWVLKLKQEINRKSN